MNKFILILLMFLMMPIAQATIMNDELSDNILDKQHKIHTTYNYTDIKKIPIKMKVVNEVRSEKELYEGELIKFRLTKDVYDGSQLVAKQGTIVTSKVKIIISAGMNGIPASIILGDFQISGVSKGCLTESYEFFGQDRSLIVYPLKWALTILPPSGSLTNFIMGGHAKIKSTKVVTIYYYPNWI